MAKALEDDIRVRSQGITKNEAELSKELDKDKPESTPLPDPVSTVRHASALEPMLSVGDRKLQLERMSTKGAKAMAMAEGVDWDSLNPTERQGYIWSAAEANSTEFGPKQGFHDFHLMDDKGNPVGYLNLSEQAGGKDLYVDMISGVNGLGPRDFGPRLMIDLLKQLNSALCSAVATAATDAYV